MTNYYKDIIDMKQKVRSLIKNNKGGIESSAIVFQLGEIYGFEKPIEKYIDSLIYFELVKSKNNKLFWLNGGEKDVL